MKIKISSIQAVGFLLFFCMIFVHYGYSKLGIFAYLIPVSVSALRILKNRSIRVNQATLWYLSFGMWVLLSELWAGTVISDSDIRIETIKICIVVISIAAFVNFKSDVKLLLKMLLVATIYLDVMMLVTTPLNLYGTDFMGDVIGIHNNAAASLSVYMAGTAGYFYLEERETNRWCKLYVIVAIFLSVFVIITQSRKSLLMLILSVCIAVLLTDNATKRVKSIFLGIIITIIIGTIILSSEYAMENYVLRIMDLVNADSTDGSIIERSYFRDLAFKMFLERPVFGWGLDGFRSEMGVQNYVHVTYSHCGYTEVACNYGLIGLLFYYLPVFIALLRSFKGKKDLFAKFAIIELSIFIIGDYGAISYYSRLTIPFIILIMHSIYTYEQLDYE